MRNIFCILFLFLIFLSVPASYAQQERAAVPYSTLENQKSNQVLITPPATDDLILWAIPIDGSTSANSRAPSNGWKYQRTEYLIPASEMTASGMPSGSVLNSIGYSIYSAGVGTLSGTLNIYLKNTTDVTYTLGTSWTVTGFTQVSTNASFSPPISPTGGVYDIPFTGGSAFTYTGGGVYVAWEFSSPSGTAGTTPVTHDCNTSITGILYGQRSATALPTTLAASNWRPATRFGTSSYTDKVNLTNIYTTERVPVPYGTPTPVSVRVENVFTTALTFDVTISVRDIENGTLRYTATQTVTGLASGANTRVNFAGWTPTILEDVNITATTSVIAGENWTANNTKTQIANVNNNLFSYCYDLTTPGGYGFTTPGEGIFTAKYTMNGAGLITGANVLLYNDPNAVGKTVYAVLLNSTGAIVAQSANLVIQSTDLGTNKHFTFATPAVIANDYFFIGLAQTYIGSTTQYYPLGLKTETPQRGNTFYTFDITGGTASVDVVDAKYMIEASVTVVSGPGVATTPTPANNAVNIATSGLTLSWTNPGAATSNRVYYGTAPETMTLISSGTLATSIAAPTPVNYFTIYYWRIDEIGPGGTTTGPVWAFRTQLDPAGVILPYSQSFDGDLLPAFWSQTYSGGITGNRWGLTTTNYAGGTANELVAISVNAIGTTRMIIGPINTTGLSNLSLSFRQFFDDYDAGVTYKIQRSPDGTTWTDQPFSFTSGNGDVGPEMVNTTVTGLTNTTYIAWVLDGDHYQFDYWFIDDISISQQYANDVATTSVILNTPLPTGAVIPKATVANLGTSANTFNVQMTITGGYTSTKSVTLASGASQQVVFDSWIATAGAHTVNVCTQLGSDQNASNNCMSKDVSVIAGWTHNAVLPDSVYLGGGAGYITGGVSYIFSIGGNTSSGLGTECYKYNVNTNTWTTIAPLPSGRRVLATAVVGDFLYAIAGSDVASVYQNTVYKYDIAGNSWTTVASLPAAIAWGKAVGYNNRVYFAGGHNGTVPLPTIYVYDVAGNTWATADSMPASRFGGAFSVVGNKLIYVGGSGYDGITNTVFVGTISSGNPLSIAWTTAANKYPGLDKEIAYSNNSNYNLGIKTNTKGNLFNKSALYPGGVMYRFDGAPWGTDGMIVAGGSPTADWIPASPNPCYVYKPGTDTWTVQGEVPTAVLGSQIGTVNSGTTWKLVVVSGLDLTGLPNNLTQIFTATVGSAPTTFPLSVNVTNGWNMVSIPGLHPTNQAVNTWWPNRNLLADVYKWAAGYVAVANAAPTEGYWMLHTGTLTYNTGDEWPAGGIQTVTHNPITVTAGWNMIGGYENSPAVTALTTTPPGLIVSGTVYGWNGTYSTPTNLVPGYGYWIYLSGAGVINIPAGSEKGLAKEDIKENWGRIIVSDASGKTFTLYSVNADVSLDNYLMPPLPPSDCFDVRFASGKKAENLNTAQTIEMTGMQYPVTVRVENATINLKDQTGKEINTTLKPGEGISISKSGLNKLIVSGTLTPVEFSLDQNYPNPFNPSTLIEFGLPEDANQVTLTIYDALGQKVAELVKENLKAGYYKYQWNGANVASGLYIYQLTAGKYIATKKMMLLK